MKQLMWIVAAAVGGFLLGFALWSDPPCPEPVPCPECVVVWDRLPVVQSFAAFESYLQENMGEEITVSLLVECQKAKADILAASEGACGCE